MGTVALTSPETPLLLHRTSVAVHASPRSPPKMPPSFPANAPVPAAKRPSWHSSASCAFAAWSGPWRRRRQSSYSSGRTVDAKGSPGAAFGMGGGLGGHWGSWGSCTAPGHWLFGCVCPYQWLWLKRRFSASKNPPKHSLVETPWKSCLHFQKILNLLSKWGVTGTGFLVPYCLYVQAGVGDVKAQTVLPEFQLHCFKC